jgi:LPS-assembly protein
MKNNLYKLIFCTQILLLSFNLNINANELKFESTTIETFKNDTIVAKGEVKVLDNDYNLEADELKLNKKTKIHILKGNVILSDKLNNKIYSEEVLIDEINKKYFFKNETIIIINNTYTIKTNDLIYDKIQNNIYSKKETTIKDDYNNIIFIGNFFIDLNDNLLKADEAKIIDNEKNTYELKKLYYNFDQKKIFGKDVQINRDNELLDKKNLARSKSRSIIIEKNKTTLKKSVYTNCKKRNGCPPWLILAENVTHDKTEQIIKYDKATLKFYDIPVIYFPKFFHPDPTVKRKSGFLTPMINSNKTSGYLKLPYFFALSDSSDFTLTPRIYDNFNNLYQGEYRKEFKSSSHIIDLSTLENNILPMNNNSNQSHIFINSNINTNFSYFENSNLDLKIQSVSNQTYLKTYDIVSPIIESQNLLNSKIDFYGNKNDLDFSLSAEIFEDLTKNRSSDRYEFILPSFSLTKILETNLNGFTEFQTSGFARIYDTNVKEKKLINNLKYISDDQFNNFGFVHNYELILKNVNITKENFNKHENEIKNNLQGLAQYNLKLPMRKQKNNYTELFTPIISAKLNPIDNKNISNLDRMIGYDSFFSINRLASNEVLEGGQSLTFGGEYKIFNNKNLDDEMFGINLAASIRPNENEDLPIRSSLNKKTSNFVGNSTFKFNEYLDLDYEFITKNNLTDINYHNVKSSFRINNFITKFEFIEENNEIGQESFLFNESLINIGENSNLLFRTRENKKTNLREYYDLIFQYKMDCLTAGIEYRKKYYSDGNLKPEENIMFSITFLPFNNTVNLPSFK